MRATIGDVVRDPHWLPDWWVELPWRRRPQRKLRVLLFEPGRGWLRWGWGIYTETEPVDGYGRGPSFDVPCAPPLRRLWARLTDRIAARWQWWRYEGDREWLRPEHFVCGDWSWAKDPEWPWGYLP